MDLTQYKIDKYADGVASLPDYPSEEGYTAEQLKAVFDSRSDNEIKNKHNELIDELTTAFVSIEAHPTDAFAHLELFNNLREEISDEMPKKLSELNDDIGLGERIAQHEADFGNPHNVTAAQIGLNKVDNTPDSEKRVAYATEASSAAHADEAVSAKFDINGKEICATYATKEEVAEAKEYTDALKGDITDGAITVDMARHADCDTYGLEIHETYETKAEATIKLAEAKVYTDSLESRLLEADDRNYIVNYAEHAGCDVYGNWISDTYVTKEEFNAAIAALQAMYTGGAGGGN